MFRLPRPLPLAEQLDHESDELICDEALPAFGNHRWPPPTRCVAFKAGFDCPVERRPHCIDVIGGDDPTGIANQQSGVADVSRHDGEPAASASKIALGKLSERDAWSNT